MPLPEPFVLVTGFVLERYALGPLASRVEARLSRVRKRALAKLGGRPFQAPDRVVAKALDEAAFVDDELMADYLGGALAASGPDDAAASVIAQIGRLSAADLRLHFVVYRELWRLLHAPGAPFLQDINTAQPEVFIPYEELATALESVERPEGALRMLASMRTLAREDLTAAYGGPLRWDTQPREGYRLGSAASLSELVGRHVPGEGAVVRTTPAGMTLLAWGVGAAEPAPATFYGLEEADLLPPSIPTCPSTVLVSNLPP